MAVSKLGVKLETFENSLRKNERINKLINPLF